MDLELLQKIAYEKMGRRVSDPKKEPGYVYNHCRRVAEISLKLRKLLYPDYDKKDDVLYVGALFHDIGKGIEPHSKIGGLIIESMIGHLCSKEEMEEIIKIVSLHNVRSSDDDSKFVKIVQDADLIDHFGTHNVWMAYVGNALQHKKLEDALEYYEGDMRKDFVINCMNMLNFEESKKIMKRRVEATDSFIRRTRAEQNGEL